MLEMTNTQSNFYHESLHYDVNINLMIYFVADMSVDKTMRPLKLYKRKIDKAMTLAS